MESLHSESVSMNEVYALIESISASEASVMIRGETGVGKNMIGRLIHERSLRRGHSFVEINCGTIPENLIESELFGYVPGAFSGASDSGQKGKIEAAHRGTLFLDEIGEISMDMQKKMLQVVQEKRMVPVGGTKYIDVDFRLITATHRNLEQRVKENRFREDLYYRINVVPIHIPSLRKRKEDLPFLIAHFLHDENRTYGKKIVLSPKSVNMLVEYDWPGNVRELQNVIERIVIISKENLVEESELRALFSEGRMFPEVSRQTLKQKMESYEKSIILESYGKGISTTQMAKELGIAQSSVVRKLQKYLRDG